jgi:SAM-dependent methyltransferase
VEYPDICSSIYFFMFFFKKKSKYTHDRKIHNLDTPKEIVPIVITIVNPKSVVDIGCGTGTWLNIFKKNGVTEYLGVEGFHLNPDELVIDTDKVLLKDLEQPFELEKKYDLALCLEVAEHLKPESADLFVESLTKVADIILFSAAIPFQGGQNHINEQWPTYWEEKFKKYNFYFSDSIRQLFWENSKIQWWYKQNMFFVAHESKQSIIKKTNTILNVVHPIVFLASKKIKGVEYQYK